MAGTPALRALLLTELLGLLAGAAGQTAMGWWIAQRGGGRDLAVYGALTAACSLAALPLLSPLGDRWPKQRLIRLAGALLVLDALVLAVLARQGLYRLPLLCACGVVSVLANALLLPVQASVLPELVAPEGLPQAIRLRRGAQAVGGLLGPGLAGLALAVGGVPLAMALNVALYALALVASLRLQPAPGPTGRAPSTGWFGDVAAGLRAKWRVRLDRWWTLTGALMMVFLIPATGMLLPLRLQSLGLQAGWFGACTAALSLGLLLGACGLADALIARVGRVRAVGAAVALCGLAIGSVGAFAWAPALVASFAAIGLCMSVTQLIGQTHRTLAVPGPFRARMAAAQLALSQVAAALAPVVAGLLLMRWEVSAVYVVSALAFVCSGLLLLAVPDLRPFLLLGHDQARDWYARQYPEAFGQPVGRAKPGLGFAWLCRRSHPLRSPWPAATHFRPRHGRSPDAGTPSGAHKHREPPTT
jgi:MFS family permease